MFDTPVTCISSGKVAVTASEIKAGAPFIFANYNGAAPHRAASAYGRLRPDSESEPLVWQVARATAAAPCLFPTMDIPGLGAFQDGGMRRHNNPINLALSEAKHLWPNCPKPDVFISLGTGSETGDSSPTVSRFRNIFVDGWVPRVYRSISSSFDGQCNWREVFGLLDEGSRGDYFRFDLSIPNGLPRLDNTECMDGLSKLVRSNPAGEKAHKEAVASLLATSFFFQLESKPAYFAGLWQCVGSIRCRAPAQHVIHCLEKLDAKPKEFYKDEINLGLHLTPDDICYHCHRYFRPLRFIVRDVKETITLSLRFGSKSHRLSAFPSTMQWFTEQQGLEWSFGTSNHQQLPKPTCHVCEGWESGRSKKRKYADI
ncbi:Patatin-like serine hydrolase [Penicillium capsulatum]|nr:Patatin-like serine hydrolase [Penicillium capsulatum]